MLQRVLKTPPHVRKCCADVGNSLARGGPCLVEHDEHESSSGECLVQGKDASGEEGVKAAWKPRAEWREPRGSS